jgi:glycosyltransferase involved in cell wall biosynthesis
MARAVRDAIDEWRPQVVQAERIGAAPYLEIARSRGIPTVYSAHNVESRISAGPESTGVRLRARLAARRMRRAELAHAARAQVVVVVSEREAAWFESIASRTCLVPNAVDLASYRFVLPSNRKGATVAFIGHLGYPPNGDAACRLRYEILPLIRRQLPETQCIIAGRAPPRRVRRLDGDGVVVVGDVRDAGEIWGQASVLVCPLRWAAGSRLKLLEAAASGVPVVASPVSAEGLSLRPNRDFLSCASSAEMAAASVALLQDRTRADALAQSALETVADRHDWRMYEQPVAQLYESLIGDHR